MQSPGFQTFLGTTSLHLPSTSCAQRPETWPCKKPYPTGTLVGLSGRVRGTSYPDLALTFHMYCSDLAW